MFWGVATVSWMSGLIPRDVDRYRYEIELQASHGLNACQWSMTRLLRMEAGRREEIAGWLEEFDVHAVLSVWFDLISADDETAKRSTDELLAGIETLPGPMRTPILTTAAGGSNHRFMRDPSLEEQMGRLSKRLAPLAEAAHRAGCPLGIENHGDYYCSDLAALCERTPHLGIFMDTGNALLVGEKPIEAARDAAPYLVGTHFKDEYARPRFGPLGFEIRGAVPGSGDVGLREVYATLVSGAPAPERLAMLMEIDQVEGVDREQALEQACSFIRSL